jgi:hypothetical protein
MLSSMLPAYPATSAATKFFTSGSKHDLIIHNSGLVSMTQPASNNALGNSKVTDVQEDALRCTVISVEKSDGPGGADGNDWYRYVINSPGSPITGYRRGPKRDILEYLNECTSKLEERLNTRKSPRSAGRKPNQAQTSQTSGSSQTSG